MIELKRADACDDRTLYAVFQEAYSDYILNITPPFGVFLDRFFGPEGNRRDLSFVAFEEERPMGLVLSGLVRYGGRMMMRCGTLAVIPSARRQGIGETLLERHLEEGHARGAEGFFLEVIVGNHRAVSFYENEGYEKVETILYGKGRPKIVPGEEIGIRPISLIEGEAYLIDRVDDRLPWQAHPGYYREHPGAVYLGFWEKEELVGVLLGAEDGHLAALHVHPRFRGKGIGRRLITAFVKHIKETTIRVSFFESTKMRRFFEGMGIEISGLKQYHCIKKVGPQ